MSFRNRCVVAGGEGVIDLSVPLEKGRDQRSFLKDVRIAGGKDWQGQHWKTIVSCYNRSPWFEYYRDGLEELYGRRMEFLLDWNLACYSWCCRMLGVEERYELTASYEAEYDPAEWVDLRGKILPKNRDSSELLGGLSGMMGRADSGILDDSDASDDTNDSDVSAEPGDSIALDDSGAQGARAVPTDWLRYRQVFEERTGFLPNLSILDLLFCEGKRARVLLG